MRYEKYLLCEFTYFDVIENQYIRLLFTNIIKHDKRIIYDNCHHCKKPLKTTIYCFTRTDSEGQEEYLFGSECVKNVFQLGLK